MVEIDKNFVWQINVGLYLTTYKLNISFARLIGLFATIISKKTMLLD